MNFGLPENLVKSTSFWFAKPASTLAKEIESLFHFINIVSVLIFIGICGFGLFCIIKYRRTPNNQMASAQIDHHFGLELAWTVIPTILVLFVFAWGYIDYLKLSIAPDNSMEITAIAQKWNWNFQYKNGVQTDRIVVPLGTPIKLNMYSRDILHGFYAPNFKIKKDVLPNKFTNVWFEANRLGTFTVFCTEYCGDLHSKMISSITVLPKDEYYAWLKEEKRKSDASKNLPPAEKGALLYKEQGCFACHSLDGSKMIGPSWKGLFEKQRNFSDGTSTIANEDYLVESIIYPAKRIVKGYPNAMASYKDILSDKDINAIIEYIKTLKD